MSNIISEVELVRKYIKKPELKKLHKNNYQEYESHLKNKFSNFSEKKPFLFDMAISQENFDFSKLKEFISMLDKVKSGKISNENASKIIGEKYYNQYVKNKVENKVEEVEETPEVKEEEEPEIEVPKKECKLEYV